VIEQWIPETWGAPALPPRPEHISACRTGACRQDWTFRTRRFEVRVWETEFMRVAEIAPVPLGECAWALAVAVDIRKLKSRQALVREAIIRATDRIIEAHLPTLNSGSQARLLAAYRRRRAAEKIRCPHCGCDETRRLSADEQECWNCRKTW